MAGGRITAPAAGMFGRVHAADPSRQMLRRARADIDASNVTFHRLDGFTLEAFEASSVDFAFSHDVFVHFSSLQLLPYFTEIGRVLRPGGRGLISLYDFNDEFELFKEMSWHLWRERRYPEHMRVHFLTEEMLRRILTESDLGVGQVDHGEFMVASFSKPVADAG